MPELIPSSFFFAVTGGLLSKLSQRVKARWKLFLSLMVSALFVVIRILPESVMPGKMSTWELNSPKLKRTKLYWRPTTASDALIRTVDRQ